MTTETERLRAALEWCARQLWDGAVYIDGLDFERELLERGLLVEREPTPQFVEEWGGDAVMYTLAWLAPGQPTEEPTG